MQSPEATQLPPGLLYGGGLIPLSIFGEDKLKDVLHGLLLSSPDAIERGPLSPWLAGWLEVGARDLWVGAPDVCLGTTWIPIPFSKPIGR